MSPDDGVDLDRLYEASWLLSDVELTDGLRALRGLLYVDGAVGNGGFILILDDGSREASSGLAEAIAGATLIGAAAHRDVVEEFARIGPATPAGETWRRRESAGVEQAAEVLSALHRLDERYYALPPIAAATGHHVDEHPADFAVATAARPLTASARADAVLTACPDLATQAAVDAEIAALTAETLRTLRPNRPDDVYSCVQAHVLTNLLNAEEAGVPITLHAIREAWRRVAPHII